MKWVTRERPKTDRVACPWLITRFIDDEAEIVYVPRDDVLATAAATGGKSFDATGADFTHDGDLCTFEVLIRDHDLGGDEALVRLARIVHGADVDDPSPDPRSAGLLAIAEGLLEVEPDDHEVRLIGARIYDALYAWCGKQP
jgi:hypothetical protein